MVLVCGVEIFVVLVLVSGIMLCSCSCSCVRLCFDIFVGFMMRWLVLRYGKALYGARPGSVRHDFIFRIYSSLILAEILF